MLSISSLLVPLLALSAAAAALEGHGLAEPSRRLVQPAQTSETAARYFTQEEIARGRAYARGRYALYLLRAAMTIGLCAVLVLTPLSGRIHDLSVSAAGGRVWLTVAIYGLLLGLLYYAIMAPLSLYGSFIREHAFGLSTQGLRSWSLDYLKSALLATGLALPLLVLLYALIRWTPKYWYLPAWATIVVVMAAVTELSPVLIDPLFHTFRPVEDPSLRTRIGALTDRAGLQVGPILVMDASRRTRKTNAYFTGLGRTRRIVLYDTLVETATPDEVELVLAHELGHWKRRHIWKGLGLSAAGLLAGLWAVSRLVGDAAASGRFGFVHPADVRSLPLLVLLLVIFNVVTMPVQQAISRAFEREADLASLHLTNNPDAFIASEIGLARANLADIHPPKAVVWFLYSHPPVLERIAMAEAYRPTGGHR
jgi:STE24 endopeptidase